MLPLPTFRPHARPFPASPSIIEPLASRCTKFRFKPLSIEAILTRLNEVKERENVNCSDEVLRRLVDLSEGDLRMAITLLQSAYR